MVGHREAAARIREAAARTGSKFSAGDVKPTPDSRAFLDLVAMGQDPRILAACLKVYLARKKAATGTEWFYIENLSTFFGMPGRAKKCTWEGFWDEAAAKVTTARMAEGSPLPASDPGSAGPLPTLSIPLPLLVPQS